MSTATQASPADPAAPPPIEILNTAEQEDNQRRGVVDGEAKDSEERREGTGDDGGAGDDEEEEEEQMECGFCLFMKGGGCKDSFVEWEKCIEEAEKNKEDMVDRCAEVTRLLRDCMLRHADYYEPLLSAEKAMEDRAARELDQEEAAASAAAAAEEDSVLSRTPEDVDAGPLPDRFDPSK